MSIAMIKARVKKGSRTNQRPTKEAKRKDLHFKAADHFIKLLESPYRYAG